MSHDNAVIFPSITSTYSVPILTTTPKGQASIKCYFEYEKTFTHMTMVEEDMQLITKLAN